MNDVAGKFRFRFEFGIGHALGVSLWALWLESPTTYLQGSADYVKGRSACPFVPNSGDDFLACRPVGTYNAWNRCLTVG